MNLKEHIQSEIKSQLGESTINEACWDNYKQVGMKTKGGKQVPNCVPEGLKEGIMSDIHLTIKSSSTEEDFIKKFFKKYGKQVKPNKESMEWVKDLYSDTKNESVNEAKEEPIVALLKLGLFASKGTGEKKLLRLSDDFEEIGDEQADEIASHLNMAIELFQDGYSKAAVPHFKKFNKACKAELALMKKQGLAESVVTEGKKFKPGDKWSNNFDYDGMLAYALKVNHKTPLKTLQKLHDSATDVNYHTPFAGLGNAIDWITDDGVNSKEGKDFIKQFHKDIKDELKESVVTEGKDDYVARYQGTNINLKKAYKHLDDEALNQVYLEIGELIADNKLKVKDATFTFEAEETPSWGNLINNINHKLNEDLRRDLKKYIDKNEDEINKLADEDAFETIYNNLRAEFDIVEGTKEDKDMIETFQFVF